MTKAPHRRLRKSCPSPIAAVALLAALALGPGCAHAPKATTTSHDFTAEALRSGGLADLGVVQVNEITTVRAPLVAALERVLTTARPDVPLVPAVRAQAMMGDTTTRFLLLGYQFHGTPEPNWLARAADSLRAVARYGMLARVESDDADPGKREARVAVVVYDLHTRKPVLSGKYDGTSDAAPRDSMPPGPNVQGQPPAPPPDPPAQETQIGPATVGIGAHPPSGPDGMPEPPPLALAVEPAFLEFAYTLPGATTAAPPSPGVPAAP